MERSYALAAERVREEPMCHLLFTYRANLAHVTDLVSDLTDEQMVQQPHGLVNHPTWTLGHLAAVSNAAAMVLGLESTFPEDWKELFKAAGGVPRGGDASAYPSKDRLIGELTAQHARVAEAVANADPAFLAKEHPREKMRKRFPTIGDFVDYLTSAHEANHIGQLAAWRRAMGFVPRGRPAS